MIQSSYEWTFRVNARQTLRQRVCHLLRALASRIDGRLSLAIDIQTKPPISDRSKLECVAFGLGQIKWAIEETTRSTAQDLVLDYVLKANHDADH